MTAWTKRSITKSEVTGSRPKPKGVAFQSVVYDPAEVEREKRRQRALGIDLELRTRIDESLSRRMPAMKRVKR